jgi:uncharacterized protein YhdP
MQHEQRQDEVQEKSAADWAKQVPAKAVVLRQQEQETQRLRMEHEKYARLVDLQVTAAHQRCAPGHERLSDGRLALRVKAHLTARCWAFPIDDLRCPT